MFYAVCAGSYWHIIESSCWKLRTSWSCRKSPVPPFPCRGSPQRPRLQSLSKYSPPLMCCANWFWELIFSDIHPVTHTIPTSTSPILPIPLASMTGRLILKGFSSIINSNLSTSNSSPWCTQYIIYNRIGIGSDDIDLEKYLCLRGEQMLTHSYP